MPTVAGADLRPPPSQGTEILTDVSSPLLGPRGSAATFGPQKGADARAVEELDAGLKPLVEQLGGEPAFAGAGAAGGIGYGFVTFWDAQLPVASRAVAEELSLAVEVTESDLVITGEGRLDATSLQSKDVSTVLKLVAGQGAALGSSRERSLKGSTIARHWSDSPSSPDPRRDRWPDRSGTWRKPDSSSPNGR